MKKPRRLYSKLFLIVLVGLALGAASWFGLVPQRWSILPPITLERGDHWFVDARLAALRFDKTLCQSVLKAPHIDATPIPDRPLKKGCGWQNAVKFNQTGGARIGVEPLTCEVAAALTLWMVQDVQPLAQEMFGKKVAVLGDYGTYDCRNIVGNPLWKGVRSQHATANAVDISGFVLEGGEKISLIRDWKGKGKKSEFLQEVHRRSCKYFRVSLGPNFNKAHRDHFHFDRGVIWTCR